MEVDDGPSSVIPSHFTSVLIEGMASSRRKLDQATVLDLGCGAGALSFRALDMGARKVVGADIDPRCIEAFSRNTKSPTPAGGPKASGGSNYDPDRFELIGPEVLLSPANAGANGLGMGLPEYLRGGIDVVLCNPSQLVLPSADALEGYSWDGPAGRYMIDPFLRVLGPLLKPSSSPDPVRDGRDSDRDLPDPVVEVRNDGGGMALMTHSGFSDPDRTLAVLPELGLEAEVVAEAMVPLYPNMCRPDLLRHLSSLPHLDSAKDLRIDEKTGQCEFRVLCFRLTRVDGN